MKKFELYLLFSTLFIGTVILIFTMYHFIKPTTIDIENLSSSLKIREDENFIDNKSGWTAKMNKIKSSHSYPIDIYKIDF